MPAPLVPAGKNCDIFFEDLRIDETAFHHINMDNLAELAGLYRTTNHQLLMSMLKGIDSDVQSAFVKGNTREHILLCYPDEHLARSIVGSEFTDFTYERAGGSIIYPSHRGIISDRSSQAV